MSILVIGNGFDLAHGLKTGYGDFIKKIKLIQKGEYDLVDLEKDIGSGRGLISFNTLKKIINQNSFLDHFIRSDKMDDSWCGVEDEIKKVIDAWKSVLESVSEEGKIENWSREIAFIMCSFETYIKVLEKDNCGPESLRPDTMKENYLAEEFINERGILKEKLIDKLKIELNKLVKAFELYLELFVETQKPKASIDMSKLNPKLVVNFNYTSTYKIYDIEDNIVKYIHGNIGSTPSNIVMGMNVYKEKYDPKFVYFMKFFQRIQKNTDIVTEDEIGGLFYSEEIIYSRALMNDLCLTKGIGQIYFYGHSMSNADGDIIRLLKGTKEKNNRNAFAIFYYDQLDYESKVINLFEVFGKDETIQMIHDKEIVFHLTSEINI